MISKSGLDIKVICWAFSRYP